MSKKIVDAKQDEKGNIIQVRFDTNSTFTDIDTAKRMADKGLIENAHVVHRQDGSTYLRTNPDSKKGNNLDDIAKDS